MMKYIALFFILSLTSLAHAETVSWNIPDARENGDELSIDEIQKYTISVKCNERDEELFDVIDPNIVSWVTPAHVVGDCDFRINTTDTDGLFSEWSNTVSKLIKLDAPERGGFR